MSAKPTCEALGWAQKNSTDAIMMARTLFIAASTAETTPKPVQDACSGLAAVWWLFGAANAQARCLRAW